MHDALNFDNLNVEWTQQERCMTVPKLKGYYEWIGLIDNHGINIPICHTNTLSLPTKIQIEPT